MTTASRREFLAGGVALASLAAVAARRAMAAASADMQFGQQLFSVDAQMSTDLPGTLRSVRQIGYRVVEPVGFYGRSGTALRQALQRAQLRCVSIHVRPQAPTPGAPNLETGSEEVLQRCQQLGVRYLVCPGVHWPKRMSAAANQPTTLSGMVAAVALFTADDWMECADWLNDLGARARSRGIQLLYHNSNVEFVKLKDTTGYEILLQQTDPRLVQLELDCGWVSSAGLDPMALLRSQSGRVPLIHIKDMASTPANNAMQLNPALLGAGIVDWNALLGAARAAGVRYAFVEQEAPYSKPPLESARLNLDFLRRRGWISTAD